MATNSEFDSGRRLTLVASHPASPLSGGPVRVGAIAGVALNDENADGTTTIDFGGVYNLSVKAINGGGNSAVAVGDALFYVDADTPNISKKVAGTFIGHALDVITSGSTATIRVRLLQTV